MWLDPVSDSGPLDLKSDALPTALRGSAPILHRNEHIHVTSESRLMDVKCPLECGEMHS